MASEVAQPERVSDPLRSAARGGTLNLAGFVSSGVLGFALAIAITRGLGEDGAGVFFSAIAVFTILSNVMELGADTGMVRFVARLRELGRWADLRRTITLAIVPVAVVSVLASVATFVWAPSIAHLFAPDRRDEVAHFLRLIAPLLPFATVSTVALAGTRGFGTMVPFASIEGFAKPAIRPLVVLVLLAGGLATGEVAIAWSLPEALGCAAALTILLRLLRRNEQHAEADDRPRTLHALAREFWAFSAPRSLGAAFQVTVIYIDLLILGHYRSIAEVGVYGAASRIVTVGTFALQAVRLAIAPHISAMLTRNDREGARTLYQTATWWLMGISWPVFLTLAAFAPFLLRVFGPEFAAGQTALLILSLAMLVNLGTGNVSMVLLMGGKSGWQLLNQGVSLAVNIALNLWLIPRYGMSGAAIAWGVAIAIDNLMAVAEVRYLFGIGPFGPGYAAVVGVTLACFGGVGLAARLLLGANLASFALYAVVSVVAFVLAMKRWKGVLRLDLLRDSFRRDAAVPPTGGKGASPGSNLPKPVRDAARAVVRTYGKATASFRPLPEFLLIGTKRGGTTSLAAYLHEHPDVAPLFPRTAVPKGVRFFDDHFVEGARWYRSHFASTFARGRSKISGEATAHYLFDPRVPERAHTLVPGAKIVVLLRDPVERAYSHHRERTRQGVETLSFEDALAAEPDRLAGELDRMLADPAYVSFEREHHSYRGQGCYFDYLPDWVERFGRDRVLVLISEDFFEDPAREYARTLAFLGLAQHAPVYEAHNYHPMQRGMDAATRVELDAFFEPFTRRLEDYLGLSLPWGAKRRAPAGDGGG